MKRDETGGKSPPFAPVASAPAFAGARDGLTEGVKPGWVYLMANHRRGQIYLGATSDLPGRAWQHRNGVMDGHSKDKGCVLLVWFEYFRGLAGCTSP